MGRIDRLLSTMTIEEKIGQLNMVASSRVVTGPGELRDVHEGIRGGRIGSLLNLWGAEEVRSVQRLAVEESRLGIPLLLGLDVIHGHHTIFPVPLAEACLFDPDLWQKTERAAAKTRGFQGQDLAAADSLAATAKHLCAYGAVTAGREYASVDVSERTLREIYLPPFSAAVAAGTAAVMPAFIDLAGVPMTANAPLLQGWLRRELGFEGVLISDYNAVAELMNHGVAADAVEAAALALKAGVDIDMTSDCYVRGLPEALKRGLVTMAEIDVSVRRVLDLKQRLGLFDDPYRRGSAWPHGARDAERGELAREVGRRAIVLLTHRAPVLPLPPETRRIALIGPLAAASREMLGPWASAGPAQDAVSILEGLKAALPQCRIDHAPGVDIAGQDTDGISAAVELCGGAEVIVLCLGEAASMSGEAA